MIDGGEGKKVYKIYGSSKIVINRHGEIASTYSNNMRLYEATGSGAAIISERSDNLDDLFKVGRESFDYLNAEDLVEKILQLLKDADVLEELRQNGCKKTRRDHMHTTRMEELKDIVEKDDGKEQVQEVQQCR